MKISITNYGREHTVEIEDGAVISDMMDALKGLLVSVGFHPATVDRNLKINDWGLCEDEQS
jgi:hypothetical protein